MRIYLAFTSVMWAVQGHRDIAGLLVNAGASAEQKNNLGLTCFERVDV